MKRWLAPAAGLVAMSLAGGALAQQVGTTASGLIDAERISTADASRIGAVWTDTGSIDGGPRCSGILLTPLWVLTVEHCNRDPGDYVFMGAVGDPATRKARILYSISPIFDPPKASAGDVALLKLDRPLYPLRPDGSAWTDYSRRVTDDFPTIPRGGLYGRPRLPVTVYGYGATELFRGLPTDAQFAQTGIPRVLGFTVFEYQDGRFELFRDRAAPGDSGSAVLFPAQDEDEPLAQNQMVIGVIQTGDPTTGITITPGLKAWIERTMATDPGAVVLPELIMNSIAGISWIGTQGW